MKIAQVCPYDFSRPGGVKTHIEGLSKYLKRLGHEVKIIAPRPNVDSPNVYHFGRNRSINLGGTKIDINIALGEDKKALKQFIEDEDFDIIHFHTFWNPALPFQIRRYSKAKHITTFHDTPKNQFVGKYIMPIAAKGVFKLMDAIISVSNSQAAYINRFSSREISIIPNGIDLEVYQNQRGKDLRFQDEKFNLLFLGRLEPRKGLIYALRIFKQLKDEFPQLRLIIAGDGDERAIGEGFVRDNNLKDVVFLGFVSEQDKLELLNATDIFLAPAIYGESFGIVLLEAMAMGTPMCGFGNEGYLRVLEKEQRNFFVKPIDSIALVQKVRKLIKSETERENLTLRGQKVASNYDWAILSIQILEIYIEVLGTDET